MPSIRPLYKASSLPLGRDNRSARRAYGREDMRKKFFRRNTLPEIEEEGLTIPLRRGVSYPCYATHPQDLRKSRDLEAGPDTPHHDHQLHSNVEMAAALVDQVKPQPSAPLESSARILLRGSLKF
jgi:two pore calcium channel protein